MIFMMTLNISSKWRNPYSCKDQSVTMFVRIETQRTKPCDTNCSQSECYFHFNNFMMSLSPSRELFNSLDVKELLVKKETLRDTELKGLDEITCIEHEPPIHFNLLVLITCIE